MDAVDFTSLAFTAESEIADLSNVLVRLSAYEDRDGKLSVDKVAEDVDYGVLETIADLHAAAKALVATIDTFKQ